MWLSIGCSLMLYRCVWFVNVRLWGNIGMRLRSSRLIVWRSVVWRWALCWRSILLLLRRLVIVLLTWRLLSVSMRLRLICMSGRFVSLSRRLVYMSRRLIYMSRRLICLNRRLICLCSWLVCMRRGLVCVRGAWNWCLCLLISRSWRCLRIALRSSSFWLVDVRGMLAVLAIGCIVRGRRRSLLLLVVVRLVDMWLWCVWFVLRWLIVIVCILWRGLIGLWLVDMWFTCLLRFLLITTLLSRVIFSH